MSKTIQASSAPTEAMVDVRPDTVTITDRGYLAWPAAVALFRQGWTINADLPPLTFENTGYATITLVRAKPDAAINAMAFDIAEKAEALAVERHAVAYQRDVAAAAIVAMEQAKKAEHAALLAAQIEAQRQTLQALEKAASIA